MLEEGEYFNGNIENKKTNSNLDRIHQAKFIIGNFKKGTYSFEKVPELPNLEYIEINCVNVIDFIGVEKFVNLKRLELHYCKKLESDIGISALKKSLEWLHIHTSKKFRFTDELLQLKNLKVLCLNNCGEIDDLSFLKYFPNLVDFRFVDTTILDGNLQPILDHPKIKNAGFLNKRHYNLKEDFVDNALLAKDIGEYKQTVFNGKWKSYRYL